MKKLINIAWLLLVSVVAFSQTSFDAKSLLSPRTGKQELVNDFAGILTSSQKEALEEKLVVFDDSTSTQIAVVIVPDLGGYEISDYTVQLGRAWGVGGKEHNNGVVLLISKGDHKLNISTGYGVEGALPDITCNYIINEVIVPSFKGDDYYGGIDKGTDAIMQAVKGEYTAPEGYHQGKGISPATVVFLIILIIVLLSLINKGGGGGSFMSRRGYRGFNGPFIFPTGGGGGGWSGGGGGGGFGGFGGGSFGGGGSSGSW